MLAAKKLSYTVDNDTKLFVDELLAKLSMRQRLAVRLWMRGVAYKDIGKILKCTDRQASYVVGLGIRKLRELCPTR